LLKRGGVSLYYTDHAVVHHLVSRQQVTRRKLLQASYLGGIELALIEATAAGPRETLRTMLARLRDLGVLALRSLRATCTCATPPRRLTSGEHALLQVVEALLRLRDVPSLDPSNDLR
jgi:hypothetical protein